jgi:hypothetical protein
MFTQLLYKLGTNFAESVELTDMKNSIAALLPLGPIKMHNM